MTSQPKVNRGRYWYCRHCREEIGWDGTYFYHVSRSLEQGSEVCSRGDATAEPTIDNDKRGPE